VVQPNEATVSQEFQTRLCEYEVAPSIPCGKPAMGIVKAKSGVATEHCRETGEPLGRGTGSLWIPICLEHAQMFPDYDGITLDARPQ